MNEIEILPEYIIVEIHNNILMLQPGLPGLSKDKSLEAALHRITFHREYSGLVWFG